MNSNDLKNEFSEKYEHFYKTHNVVLSLPLLINWASDIDSKYKGVYIKQKIPLRIYVGVNKIQEKKIIFKNIEYFNILKNQFEKSKLKKYNLLLIDLEEYFNEKLSDDNLDYGLEFNILFEGSKGLGLGYESILISLFIAGYDKVVNNSVISKDCRKENLLKVLGGNNFYTNIINEAKKINAKLGQCYSFGLQIPSIFDSSYPIVLFGTKPRDEHIFAYRLDELVNDKKFFNYIPIDYGLIYSGFPVLIDNIINDCSNTDRDTINIKNNIVKWFGKDLEGFSDEEIPDFYKNSLGQDNHKRPGFKETYSNMMKIVSLKILDSLYKIYSKGFDELEVIEFLDRINDIRRFNLLTKKCSSEFKYCARKIIENFPSDKHLGLGVNDTMTMGGNLLFTIPYEGYRTNILESIKKTQKDIPNIRLLYSSWEDGTETKGLILEQDIENKIFSKYINKTDYIIIDKEGRKKIVGSDYNNFFTEGLFLDLVKNKINLNGRKLTSQDIKSQNTTIEILIKLLENKGNFVSNKELTLSSYSTNKNDMLSKIISPLEKLIKSENNIDFKIICTGSINDFKLKLEPTDINIYIIKYLN